MKNLDPSCNLPMSPESVTALPDGSSTHGASGGALGDASMSDLDTGFTKSGLPQDGFDSDQQPKTVRPETVGSALDAFVVGAQQATQP